MLTKFEAFLIAAITAVILTILYFIVPQQDHTIVNAVATLSALVTVIGFYITIKQLKSVGHVAAQIDLAVKSRLTDFNKSLLLSDISSKIALINEIKGHLRNDQFEVCIIRMEDLKKVLSTLVPNVGVLSIGIDEGMLDQITRNFTIDMNSIEKKLLNGEYKIRLEKVISNMDELSTYLLKLEVKLKQY